MFEESGYLSIFFEEADNRLIQSGERFVTVIFSGIVHCAAIEDEATAVSAGIFGNTFLIGKTGDLHNKLRFLWTVRKLFQFGKFFQYVAEIWIFGVRLLQ